MKLVAGLGNPGKKYQQTRHNVGFEVLAELAGRQGTPQSATRFDGEVVELMIGGEKLILLAPHTFMNASGRSVRKCFDFYQFELSDLVVVCDDLNLDLGRLRWRAGGSAGGQKGLKDIIRHLGTEEFPRLRIGIGNPPERMDSADFVLSRFTAEERSTVDRAIVAAADSLECWVSEGIDACMNKYNAGEY